MFSQTHGGDVWRIQLIFGRQQGGVTMSLCLSISVLQQTPQLLVSADYWPSRATCNRRDHAQWALGSGGFYLPPSGLGPPGCWAAGSVGGRWRWPVWPVWACLLWQPTTSDCPAHHCCSYWASTEAVFWQRKRREEGNETQSVRCSACTASHFDSGLAVLWDKNTDEKHHKRWDREDKTLCDPDTLTAPVVQSAQPTPVTGGEIPPLSR